MSIVFRSSYGVRIFWENWVLMKCKNGKLGFCSEAIIILVNCENSCWESERDNFWKSLLLNVSCVTVAADDKFYDMFIDFRGKIRLDISCESSAGRRFPWNNKHCKVTKNSNKIWNCRLLQILDGTLRILVSWRLIDNDSVDNTKHLGMLQIL